MTRHVRHIATVATIWKSRSASYGSFLKGSARLVRVHVAHDQRVAVGGRFRDDVGAYRAGRAGAVVDEHGLA